MTRPIPFPDALLKKRDQAGAGLVVRRRASSAGHHSFFPLTSDRRFLLPRLVRRGADQLVGAQVCAIGLKSQPLYRSPCKFGDMAEIVHQSTSKRVGAGDPIHRRKIAHALGNRSQGLGNV